MNNLSSRHKLRIRIARWARAWLPSKKPPYHKKHLDFSQQVELLTSRGLAISDKTAAESFLQQINYYRLSAYSRVFYQPGNGETFIPGTRFEQVQSLYEFDRALRSLINEALEPIEVSVRTGLAYQLAHKYGPFAHTMRKIFSEHSYFSHAEWMDHVEDETTRSREVFIQHFQNTYAEFPALPVWTAVEIMSFGTLSKMFANLNSTDQAAISARYGFHQNVITSWLHTIVYVRNICAHHARLWNRELRVKPLIPKKLKDWQVSPRPGQKNISGLLFLVNALNTKIPVPHFDPAKWRASIEALMSSDRGVKDFLARMGLAEGWNKHPLWR